MLAKNRVELTWKPPADTRPAGYHIERAVVEVWSEDQLTRLKRNTLPLPSPSVGAIRRIGQFERLTEKPITALSFTDDTADSLYSNVAVISKRPPDNSSIQNIRHRG